MQKDEGVLVIDDSSIEKPYTDENELICWHYDHSKGSKVKGINFITNLYVVDIASAVPCGSNVFMLSISKIGEGREVEEREMR